MMYNYRENMMRPSNLCEYRIPIAQDKQRLWRFDTAFNRHKFFHILLVGVPLILSGRLRGWHWVCMINKRVEAGRGGVALNPGRERGARCAAGKPRRGERTGMKSMKSIVGGVPIALAAVLVAAEAQAATLTLGNPYLVGSAEYNSLHAPEASKYLLIGNGPVNDFQGQPGVGDAVNMNNFELGANKAPVPSPSGFGVDATGSSLLGNTLDIPGNAATVEVGIGGQGNIAVTNADGEFNLQDVGVYADIGIKCAQTVAGCNIQSQNSFFNDPNQFPNSLPVGSSEQVNPNEADQTTRIDPDGTPGNAGVSGNTDFSTLMAEVFDGTTSFKDIVPALTATGSLASDDGEIQTDDDAIFAGNAAFGGFARSGATIDGSPVNNATFTIHLAPGLHIIDVTTKDNDFSLDGVNLVIDGLQGSDPEDTFVIFRLVDNMLITNSNVLSGQNIGLQNILFFSSKDDNNQHFNFSNTVLNGAAFWTTAQQGGEINIDNAQGCTQLVADKITLNDVRFNRCAFYPEPPMDVPEPATLTLFSLGAGALVLFRRRRQRAA